MIAPWPYLTLPAAQEATSVKPVRFFTVLALFALIAGPAAAEPKGFKTLAIGDAAPDFALPGVDGRTHALKDFADAKALVVIFTCNHCPTANAYAGRVQKLHDDFKDKGVALVAISPNDPLAAGSTNSATPTSATRSRT